MNSKFGALVNVLAKADIKGQLFDPSKVKKNKQRRYLHLMRGINMDSHSTSEKFYTCERKFYCSKLQQNNPLPEESIITLEGNIDFAFGKAVEAGVQAALLGHPKWKIWWDMYLAWDIKLMQEHPRNYYKRFVDAVIAIDKFLYIKDQLMQGWEIAMFRGKPAIELAMLLDLENGYFFVGHADIILYHPSLKRYRVLEIKTTGTRTLHEAMYKNSGQGTGYSIFLDEIAKDVELASTFEVFYLVWPVALDNWKIFEFTKSRSARAAWINTLLLDTQRKNTYQTLNFWPKRGSACFDYYRPCEFLDSCDLPPESFNGTGELALITKDELDKHEFDFRFKLSDVLKTQQELIS